VTQARSFAAFVVTGIVVSAVAGAGACTVEPAYPPPATAGGAYPPPPGYSAPPPGGPIEAGCGYSATQLPNAQPGLVFEVACPPGCTSGGLWGTDVYTADSGICHAGIHAGAISPGGGVVSVRVEPGRPAYRGSVRNNIASSDYGSYNLSYVFVNANAAAGAAAPAGGMGGPVAPVGGAPVIEAGCSFSATQIQGGAPGITQQVSCPAGCENGGGLWGTDVYTADSGICRAAIHAGLISPAGGVVTVILEPGRPAYRGSTRNGVTSSDYGNYGASFRLSR